MENIENDAGLYEQLVRMEASKLQAAFFFLEPIYLHAMLSQL
jgi:hypothetical protein